MSKVFIVGGVSGSGKTTIGRLVAERLKLPFFDADDFHPDANVAKMHAGHALNDEDRKPWLDILAEKIGYWENHKGAVLACSALKERYRQALMIHAKEKPVFIFIEGTQKLISDRLSHREDHFFNPKLLKSQFDIYEEPDYGIKVDAALTPVEIVDKITAAVADKNK